MGKTLADILIEAGKITAAESANHHTQSRWWGHVNIALRDLDQPEALWGEVSWRFDHGHTVETAVLEIVADRKLAGRSE